MLIPGNRTLLFLLLVIICPLFWRREDTFFFLFDTNLTIHTTSLSKLNRTQTWFAKEL